MIRRMEIRLVYGNELQMAVYAAREVFEACARPYVRTQAEVDQFYRYVQVEYLWQEMSAGRLFLWGAFEGGQLCAVSAMQNVGHITMLYVKPYFARRRLGTQLVNHMCAYAARVLHRERVTINVTPVAAAPYFYHIGFTLIQGSPVTESHLPLERRIWAMHQNYIGVQPAGGVRYVQIPPNAAYPMPQGMSYPMMRGMPYPMPQAAPKRPEITYPTRRVSRKLVLALMTGVLVFSFAVVGGVTIHHMAVDGLLTDPEPEMEEWQPPEGSQEL